MWCWLLESTIGFTELQIGPDREHDLYSYTESRNIIRDPQSSAKDILTIATIIIEAVYIHFSLIDETREEPKPDEEVHQLVAADRSAALARTIEEIEKFWETDPDGLGLTIIRRFLKLDVKYREAIGRLVLTLPENKA